MKGSHYMIGRQSQAIELLYLWQLKLHSALPRAILTATNSHAKSSHQPIMDVVSVYITSTVRAPTLLVISAEVSNTSYEAFMPWKRWNSSNSSRKWCLKGFPAVKMKATRYVLLGILLTCTETVFGFIFNRKTPFRPHQFVIISLLHCKQTTLRWTYPVSVF